MESHCLLLVEMRKHRFLSCARSALVMKPAPLGYIDASVLELQQEMIHAHTRDFLTASLTFSTLISEKPRILSKCLLCCACTA